MFITNIDEVNEEYLTNMMLDGYKYQLHYVDYDKNMWTAPVNLSPNRIAYILNDHSIDKVKLISGNEMT